MPTTRFASLIGVPERTWRRHQARARVQRPCEGSLAAPGAGIRPRGRPSPRAGSPGLGPPQGLGDVQT